MAARLANLPGPRSADLVDADEIAAGVAEGAVSDSPGLVGRLLHDIGATRLHSGEHVIDIGDSENDAGKRPLGHHAP